jgi:hypothetical protein
MEEYNERKTTKITETTKTRVREEELAAVYSDTVSRLLMFGVFADNSIADFILCDYIIYR